PQDHDFVSQQIKLGIKSKILLLRVGNLQIRVRKIRARQDNCAVSEPHIKQPGRRKPDALGIEIISDNDRRVMLAYRIQRIQENVEKVIGNIRCRQERVRWGSSSPQ